jgi:arsenate reductase
VTLARAASDTFAGIRPADAPGFIAAQLVGAAASKALFRWLAPPLPKDAESAHARKETNPHSLHRRIRHAVQMAEGLLRHDAGDRFKVFSAGTRPSQVRPEAIAAMSELGIDISRHSSKRVDDFACQSFDCVLTVRENAKECCPILPGNAASIHQSFEDRAAFQGSEGTLTAPFRDFPELLWDTHC